MSDSKMRIFIEEIQTAFEKKKKKKLATLHVQSICHNIKGIHAKKSRGDIIRSFLRRI